jgi:hypothetical protein
VGTEYDEEEQAGREKRTDGEQRVSLKERCASRTAGCGKAGVSKEEEMNACNEICCCSLSLLNGKLPCQCLKFISNSRHDLQTRQAVHVTPNACVCSLIFFRGCKAHAPHFIVICGLSGFTIFFNIIS